ncbi:MAG: hypothetical protein ABW193_07340, partial [Luteibacter sp.]
MNPNTPPPSDDELPDERELGALYARLPKAEPDAALDEAVLAQAARAIPRRRRPRWPVAVGSAAVLLLAAGVAWQVRDALPPPPAGQTVASAPPSAEPVATPAAAPAAPAVIADDAAKPAPRAVPPTAHATPARRATRNESVVTAETPVSSYAPVAAPAPAPAAPMEPPSPPVPPPPPMPSTPPPAAMPVPSAPSMSMAPAEPAPVVSSREDALHGYAAADAAREMGQLEAAKSAPVLGPDDRVGDIRRLLDRGQREEALRRLRELRRLYP